MWGAVELQAAVEESFGSAVGSSWSGRRSPHGAGLTVGRPSAPVRHAETALVLRPCLSCFHH